MTAAHTAAAQAAMTVPGVNRAEFRPGPGGPEGTVRYCQLGRYGCDCGPAWPAAQVPGGWNVNGHHAAGLPAAIRAAIAAQPGGKVTAMEPPHRPANR